MAVTIKKNIKKVINFLLTPRGHVKVHIGSIDNAHRLIGKKILITGGGSGLGLEMARKFISEGAYVLICGRNEDKLKNVAESLGEKCFYLKHDASKVEESENLLKQVIAKLGDLDCLVCNAGISLHEGSIENVTIDGYDQQIGILLRANFFLAQAFVKHYKHGSNSDLLFISSMTGNAPAEIPYGIAKAALSSMVSKLNREHYTKGLRVNAIAPGMCPTDLTKSYIDTSDGNMYCYAPSGRYFYPSEIAEVAAWLLCDASRIIGGGKVITCDGGCTNKNIWH